MNFCTVVISTVLVFGDILRTRELVAPFILNEFAVVDFGVVGVVALDVHSSIGSTSRKDSSRTIQWLSVGVDTGSAAVPEGHNDIVETFERQLYAKTVAERISSNVFPIIY